MFETKAERQRWLENVVLEAKKQSTCYDAELYGKTVHVCDSCKKEFYHKPYGENSRIMKGMKFCHVNCRQRKYSAIRKKTK